MTVQVPEVDVLVPDSETEQDPAFPTYVPAFSTMWAVNDGPNDRRILGFPRTAALPGHGADPPAIVITLNVLPSTDQALSCIAFGPDGSLWVSTGLADGAGGFHRNVVVRLTPDQLLSSGTVVPAMTITLPAIDSSWNSCNAIAFDQSGALWCAFGNLDTAFPGHVIKYGPSQIGGSGTPAPQVVLTIPASLARCLEPLDMAFDAAGNLWLATYGSTTFCRLSASQLLSSATGVVPDVFIGGLGSGVIGLAVDPVDQGLWVSCFNTGTLAKYRSEDVQASGAPAPEVVLFPEPSIWGLSLDEAGNLWGAVWGFSRIYSFAASDVRSSGAPVPASRIFGAPTLLNFPSFARFAPQP